MRDAQHGAAAGRECTRPLCGLLALLLLVIRLPPLVSLWALDCFPRCSSLPFKEAICLFAIAGSLAQGSHGRSLLPQPAACEALMTSTVPSGRACTYTAAVEHESQCTQMVAAGFDCETLCATLLLTKKSSPESAESCRT